MRQVEALGQRQLLGDRVPADVAVLLRPAYEGPQRGQLTRAARPPLFLGFECFIPAQHRGGIKVRERGYLTELGELREVAAVALDGGAAASPRSEQPGGKLL
jgi:hypothetical protein